MRPERFLAADADRRQLLLVVVVVAVGLVLGTVVTGRYLWFLRDPDAIRTVVDGFGPLAPLVFVLLQTLQVVVAPVPGQVLAFAAGYLFGAGPGFAYSMTGATVGTYLALLLARRYGRPYVERVVAPDALDRFDDFLGEYGLAGVFVVFLLPGFPDDVICFAAGMSDLDVRKLVLVSVAGRTPGYLVLVFSGAGMAQEQVYQSVGLLVAAGCVGIALFWKREIVLRRLATAKNR
ncbi:TVP38/TMEM64 family protein [Haloarchaeobius sp. DYHT-AS-18]|uniref:TVP38/TMEM64 family protein n=1 Tax=Haloarchaeobius sp. DYHT-AS-18 TaxID=3446117 RepID=UPI003EBC2D79